LKSFKSVVSFLALSVTLATFSNLTVAHADDDIVVTTTGNHINVDRYDKADINHSNLLNRISAMPVKTAASAGFANVNPILYHASGPVMINPNVYIIYYGSWGSGSCSETGTSSSAAIINDFFRSVGNSAWYGINTLYYSGSTTKTYVTKTVNLAGCTVDNYSKGNSLGFVAGKSVPDIVNLALQSNKFISDPQGIYFVLTSSDVTETFGGGSNFGTVYCGYHSWLTPSNLKYSFVGDASNYSGCLAQTGASPNGNPAADGMISVIAHELVETVSDPLGSSWYDSAGNENADKCAWTFGATSAATGGGSKNMSFGGRDYLIQQNWIPTGTQTCGLSFTPPALSATSVASVSATINKALTNTTLVTASGGTAPYTFTISPALPTGLSFNTSTAVLSGTPTQLMAPTTFTITLKDSVNATITKTVSIQVTAPALTSTASAAVYTMVGTNLAGSTLLTASGGTAPYRYSISGTLPAGLNFNTTNAVLSGTPTASSPATSYNVSVIDSSNTTVTKAITIQSSAALIATQTAPTITATRTIVLTAVTPVTGSGSVYTAYTYSISPKLPTGLTFSTTNGRVSGTLPSNAAIGTTTYTVTVTDAKKFTATNTFQLTVK
jgi:hypothetical protein